VAESPPPRTGRHTSREPGRSRPVARPRYERNPRYAPVGGAIAAGFDALAAAVPAGPALIALDGPAILDWEALTQGLADALAARDVRADLFDLRAYFAPWDKILVRTSSGQLDEDPDFARLPECVLADLFDALPQVGRPDSGLRLVYGPGSALVPHDLLWYADLPKRRAEAALRKGARNVGQRTGSGTTKRLFYVDWPVLDRHRDAIASRIGRYIDTGPMAAGGEPTSVSGPVLRATLAELAVRPFRARPTFASGSWGGHWAQSELGFDDDLPNTALGYELIAPESGVLIGPPSGRNAPADTTVEVPFALLVSLYPTEVLGPDAHRAFGTSFPVRFDYLDTVGGGNLSVHVHPRHEYMREVFGWPYTQHETYYVMTSGDHRKIFLGLRDGADIARFHRSARAAARDGVAFDIEEYVQTFPATPHQLFMIPAGTPHGSGEGNAVLEVSATPYLYSLRFYDWLRRGLDGAARPIHIDHAFANLDPTRSGPAVPRDLVPAPRVLRSGDGYSEELLGAAPEMFFEVRRVTVDTVAPDDTGGQFHVYCVVEGDGVVIQTARGDEHLLAYAETVVVPARVGAYQLVRTGDGGRCRLIKALVR
jgi:mannose-6-phosphate isomerase class I